MKTVFSRDLIPWRDPLEAFVPLRDSAYALLFYSPGGQWSYICANPVCVVTTQMAADARHIDEVRALTHQLKFQRPADAPPFCGGWAGLLSYEYGRVLVPNLKAQPVREAWPDVALGLYSEVIAFNHATRKAEYWRWHWGKKDGPPLSQLICVSDAPTRSCALASGMPHPIIADTQYKESIARTVAYIHAGDCFQANISQRFDFELEDDAHPYDLMRRLSENSPAPFSAYYRLPGHALVSNSPERFLKVQVTPAGVHQVTTQPIKGTRPRGRTPDEDKRLADDLLNSEKDRAENLMIVDLMRNDLSRVSKPGSVKVPKLNALESYANVHHLVSTVTSELQEGRDALDVIRVAFPGGSITGAPKVRAMQIITELEQEARGPYCGSLLWMSPDGNMDSSILIRSVALSEQGASRWKGHFRSGGGIVSDSIPSQEYQETLDKASAMTRALMEYAIPETMDIAFKGAAWMASPEVSVRDRAFLLGDGCFETLRLSDGSIEGLDEHIALLRCSLSVLGINGVPEDEALRQAFLELAERVAGDAALRITVSRGAGGRGAVAAGSEPLTVLSVTPLSDTRPYAPMKTITASIRRNETSPLSQIKSTSYGENLVARRQASEAGADESLMLNMAGRPACFAMGNLFLVTADGVWVTPPEEEGVRPGYMRASILRRLQEEGTPCEIRAIEYAELIQPGAQIFGANSLWGLRDVASLDGRELAQPHR
ncbi:aminodeoxychorismate synthase component I [Hyphomonas pacifica]|uniref:aminodeoxychorismate synthase component I n=1 Tax=Hyphomonas pacifica TaxID=1280941 RepID=UPI0009E07BB9